METNVFAKLNAINVNEHTEKKGNLTYLSWAWAWAEVKKAFSDAFYTIYENKDGLNYHHDGRTAWVKTGVTINGLEMIEYLPVMNSANKSIPLASVTSFDINKTIQRSLTKACARHGLGLYIYAGEDLPEDDTPEQPKKSGKKVTPAPAPAPQPAPAPAPEEDDNLALVKQLIKEATTKEALLQIWNDWPEAHNQIKGAFSARRKQLGF